MNDKKKPRFFIRNPDSNEPWAYCGGYEENTRADLALAFGHMVLNEIEADMGGADGNCFALEVKMEMMTDAEVAAIPEM